MYTNGHSVERHPHRIAVLNLNVVQVVLKAGNVSHRSNPLPANDFVVIFYRECVIQMDVLSFPTIIVFDGDNASVGWALAFCVVCLYHGAIG